MDYGRIARLSLLMFALAGTAQAADKATLADAAEQRNRALIRELLATGADVNAAQVDGMTALHWAVYNDDAETAGLLVRSRANVNATNRYGVPPLFIACTNGNATLVRLLLDAGANANASLPGGETVLMTAARVGKSRSRQGVACPRRQSQRAGAARPDSAHVGRRRRTRDCRASPHRSGIRDQRHARVRIHAAVLRGARGSHRCGACAPRGRRECERDVEAQGGSTRADSRHELQASQKRHQSVADGGGERPLRVGDRVGRGWSRSKRSTDRIQSAAAISWVRKPDASDVGDPPPIGSGRLTSLQFVRALVDRGANVNARLGKGVPRPPVSATMLGTEGATPFLMAADRADVPLMRELLKAGADPFLPNADKSTPLMAAAGLGTSDPLEEAGTEDEALEAMKMLLDLGADINAVDNKGDTAMHGAAYGNFPTIVQLLADRGADVNIWKQPDTEGRTPLFIAEGYKAGRPQPSRPTIDAIQRLMAAAGVSTEGTRPRIRDIYEKSPVAPEKPQKP